MAKVQLLGSLALAFFVLSPDLQAQYEYQVSSSIPSSLIRNFVVEDFEDTQLALTVEWPGSGVSYSPLLSPPGVYQPDASNELQACALGTLAWSGVGATNNLRHEYCMCCPNPTVPFFDVDDTQFVLPQAAQAFGLGISALDCASSARLLINGIDQGVLSNFGLGNGSGKTGYLFIRATGSAPLIQSVGIVIETCPGIGTDDSIIYDHIAWCPAEPAAQVKRNSVPPNPDVLEFSQVPPVLGSVWKPRVNHGTFLPSATLDILGISLGPAALPGGALGTLLCDIFTPGQLVAFIYQPQPDQGFEVPIPPNKCGLVGLQLYTQALSIQGEVLALTNAIDIILGSY